MTMQKRAGLLFSTLLIALAAVSAATAKPPERTIIPAGDDYPITDQCAFPVLVHSDGSEIITTFFDKAGDQVKFMAVFPGHKLTLTNLDTGKSITVTGTGLFLARLEPDGSGSFMVTGHGPPPPTSGEPGIWYFTGRISVTFDADENVTSVESAGTLVDLCPQLSP